MIWRFSDVHDNEQYRLHLCESNEGNRFYRLVALGSDADKTPADDVFLITAPVPNDLLKRRNLETISETVPLIDGQRFFVEAHGMWLAASEVQEMDAGVDYNQIRWMNGQVPNFPPR